MMTRNRVILTFSGRMRSGKDVLCRAMENAYDAKTFSLATHLKNLCLGILAIEYPDNGKWTMEKMDSWKNQNLPFGETGIALSEASIELMTSITGFSKDTLRAKANGVAIHNVRELLQKVGTEIIRSIDPEWHIRKTLQDINELPESTIALVDDIRFKNELNAFRNVGADSFYIIRCNAENISNHESETSLTHFDFPDNRVILNINTENELYNEFVEEFKNGFNITVKTPIFLIEHDDYRTVNRKFALKKTPLVEELVRQNRTNDLFLKQGYITFRNNKAFKLKDVLEEMGNSNTYKYEMLNGRFVITNPLAYENIKRLL